MPHFRLCYPLYDLASSSDQDLLRKAVRRHARAFLGLPRTTPNRIIEGMLGDLGPLALGVCRTADELLDARTARKPPDYKLLKSLAQPPELKLIPDSLFSALKLTYGRLCGTHGVPLRVSHLI